MPRFLMQLAAVVLGLSVTGYVMARGDHGSNGGSKGSSAQSSSQNTSSKFNKSDTKSGKDDKNYSKFDKKNKSKDGKCFDKDHFCWSKSCWCSRFGCNCYWQDDCWYVWYPRTCQYIPYAYFATFATPVIATTGPATLVPGVSAPVPGPGPGPGPKQGP
jgi:hypothetical protein